jgi:hypothetical protein
MATLLFKNNASTTLSGSINNTQTSVTVASSSGFPVPSAGNYFYATMYETSGNNPAVEINIEIIKVTAVSGNVWTIVRAQDDSSARSRDGVTTCYVELRWTAASSALMLQKDNNLSDLTNASTARTNLGLGTLATQAANNVTITGGAISGVTLTNLDSETTFEDNVDATKKFRFEVSGVTTGTTRVLTVPDADGTIATTAAVAAGYQPLDPELTAIASLAGNGIVAKTGATTAAARTLTAPAAGIAISNADGVLGNPTLFLANDLAAVESISTTGFVKRTAADSWTAAAIADGDLPAALTGKTYNGLTPTANATGFSLAGGTTSKTLTVNNSITLTGTDGTTITFPTISGTLPLNNQQFFIGTTNVAINRASASQTLTGVSIDGSAASASTATTATTATNIAGGAANQIPVQSGSGATTFVVAPSVASTYLQWTGSAFTWSSLVSGGTVTSVAVSSSDLTVTGSPITISGTIDLALNTVGIAKGGTGQTTATAAFNALSPSTTLGDLIFHDGTDNVRLAGNTTTNRRFLRQTGTGTVSAAPAWDALTNGDIPGVLTGKLYNGLSLAPLAVGFQINGGTTGKTLAVVNDLTLAGTDASTLNIGSGGTLGSAAFIASTAFSPAAGSANITTVGTIGSGTWQGSAIGISYGGTGQTSKVGGFNALSPVTTLGDLIYGDGANSNTRLAGNTTTSKRFLTQTGTGSVSAAPGWNAIVDGDIPSALTGKTYNGLALTANATGFQIAGGTTSKTLQVNNNLTFAGTDGTQMAFPSTSATIARADAGQTFFGNQGFANNITVNGNTTLGSTSANTVSVMGFLGIGTTASNAGIYVGTNSLTSSTNFGVYSAVIGNSAATTGVIGFYSAPATANATFTSAEVVGFRAANANRGASSTITSLYGVYVQDQTQGTSNYGIRSAVSSGANKWNIYADGTAANYFGGDTTLNASLIFNGTSRRIQADFSNATLASRAAFQTSTTNGTTAVQAIANGTAAASYYVAFAGSDPANAAYGWISATTTGVDIYSDKTGTGTVQPIRLLTGGTVRATAGALGGFDLATGLREARVAVAASNIDLLLGNYFTKSVGVSMTFTVSNVPPSGTAVSFILDFTNGGAGTITWWPGVKWTYGAAPVLTASGRDVLGFFTHDGGTTWTGLVLGKDVK